MARSIIDGSDIGEAMREIERREKPWGGDDTLRTFQIDMVPLHEAEHRVVGLVKLQHARGPFLKVGQICQHCKIGRSCECYGPHFYPTHWGKFPEGWSI